ncbi:RNA polymerase sigma factor [Streptomyces sp. NPDC056309]|uniref:RNA polymerase sigma factor n=1 Tax=unclassified Streptomyces TaxID=2593676 RepID=UPI0035DB024C
MDDWSVELTPWWAGGSPFEDETVLVNARLNHYLAFLPEHTRRMLRMVYDGYDYAEIGETLGITAKMAADRIHRPCRRLQERRNLFQGAAPSPHERSSDARPGRPRGRRPSAARTAGATGGGAAMTKTTVPAALYDFVLHDVAGNVVAGLVLLATTAGWQRARTRRQARRPPSAIERDEPPS